MQLGAIGAWLLAEKLPSHIYLASEMRDEDGSGSV